VGFYTLSSCPVFGVHLSERRTAVDFLKDIERTLIDPEEMEWYEKVERFFERKGILLDDAA